MRNSRQAIEQSKVRSFQTAFEIFKPIISETPENQSENCFYDKDKASAFGTKIGPMHLKQKLRLEHMEQKRGICMCKEGQGQSIEEDKKPLLVQERKYSWLEKVKTRQVPVGREEVSTERIGRKSFRMRRHARRRRVAVTMVVVFSRKVPEKSGGDNDRWK